MDTRDWAKARRERTRHLIELGGLVQKSGLVELTGDDRAALLGAFLDMADAIKGDGRYELSPAQIAAHWRKRGRATFDADEAAVAVIKTRDDPG